MSLYNGSHIVCNDDYPDLLNYKRADGCVFDDNFVYLHEKPIYSTTKVFIETCKIVTNVPYVFSNYSNDFIIMVHIIQFKEMWSSNEGSYVSVYVLLNLLKEFRKR